MRMYSIITTVLVVLAIVRTDASPAADKIVPEQGTPPPPPYHELPQDEATVPKAVEPVPAYSTKGPAVQDAEWRHIDSHLFHMPTKPPVPVPAPPPPPPAPPMPDADVSEPPQMTDGPPPEGSLVHHCEDATTEKVCEYSAFYHELHCVFEDGKCIQPNLDYGSGAPAADNYGSASSA